MWTLTDELRQWILSKEKTWRKSVFSEAAGTVTASCDFSNQFESQFKELKNNLPKHKSRYAPGKRVAVQFDSLADLEKGIAILSSAGIQVSLLDGWANRAITRDIEWGIPLPASLQLEQSGKSFYVWPESLIAPIGFTKLVLQQRGGSSDDYALYWKNPKAKIAQFVGIDNVFFYVVMQGALWLGSQDNPYRMPAGGELQLTDVFANFHLQLNGAKMSKSTGNFYTADQLLDEFGYEPDQIRYFLALLSLSKKQSNFDFASLNERNEFLAGPMNAAFEKPISAALSRFDGKVPDGKLIGSVGEDTKKIVQMYMKFMERAEYSEILFAIENYTRLINKLFNQFKPHDDRSELEGRTDALFSSFFILKNLMIMLYPFVPTTMEKLRKALNLSADVWKLSELGTPIPGGHEVGPMQSFFPAVGTLKNR
jgi:methionyl-tRNA synthetase